MKYYLKVSIDFQISRKARELGTQIQQWDERNGVSEAITNGIKKAANAVEGAVKDYADKSRKNPNVRIDRFERKQLLMFE